MQQTYYNKINLVVLALVVFCTIIAILVLVFFLTPMMQFGGGPFGMGGPPTIPDDVLQNLEDEIYALESVTTFKETFPNYRESFKQTYGVEYLIQARNENTGNVFSLNVNYNPMGPPGSTDKFMKNKHLNCFPGEGVVGPESMMMNQMFGMNGEDLFIHETIKNTDCLNDDWQPVMVTEK